VGKRLFILFFLLLLTIGCGCSAAPSETAPAGSEGGKDGPREEVHIEFFAMDTYMTVRAWGAEDALLQQVQELVLSLEASLSATREDSEVSALNRDGSAELSPRSAELLRRALLLCEETGGALDISIYPVVRAWGFTSADGAYRVPEASELRELLKRVDYRRIRLEGAVASLDPGMEIDLGAVTKGYTGDEICRMLREAGVSSALLDLGGNVQALGAKPDGSDWRIAIRDPAGEDILGILSVSDKAVITSGGYERFFIDEAGSLWWHILDPSTGTSARNGLISVTVVGEEGLTCDALSTGLFILGPEEAIAYWRSHRDFEMALVTDDGLLLLTPGLADCFTPSTGLAYALAVIEDD